MASQFHPTTNHSGQRIGELNRVLFNDCLRNARECGDVGQFEELLQWCSVAAWSASGLGWFGEMSSLELERQLVRAAEHLPRPGQRYKTQARKRYLHVFTEAYATLGHTNLCRRWIQFDPEVTHDVLLLSQRGPAPENLVQAAQQTGGQCVVLDATAPWLQRANQLRQFAWENSDVVVLHTHPDEVMGVVAFGISGGPVVIVMNHADHVFWAGCAVADLILEIRRSGHDWTRELRGREQSTILPIPLEERSVAKQSDEGLLIERQALRRKLGLPDDAIMLLTVGSASKYEPMPGLNFLTAAQDIVAACENTYLVAVGPKDEGVWKAAKQATGGRILPIGYQPDSTVFCRAADLYLEGFPLGSLTALLEAGQAKLMFVRAPQESPVPFCSDSLSIEHVLQPASLQDYVRTAIGLVRDEKARRAGGVKLQVEIAAQHCGAGWAARLAEIRAQLPQEHRVTLDFSSRPARNELRDWFLSYSFRNVPIPTQEEIVTRIFVEAWKRTTDLQPRVSPQLWSHLLRVQKGGPISNSEAIVLLGWGEKIKLWRLNRRLASQGNRQRFLSRANTALRSGKPALARSFVYRCLWASPTCWLDSLWWKQFVKAHMGQGGSSKLRALFSRKRQFSR